MPTDQQNFDIANETILDPNLLLMEFWQEFSSTRHRAVKNNEDVIYAGNTYVKAAMNVTLPNSGDTQHNTSVTFSNVTRDLGKAALAAVGKIQCRLIQVDGTDFTGSNPRTYNTALWDTDNMIVLSKVDINTLTISGDLVPKLDLLLPYPLVKTSAEFYPGLWLV